MLASSTCTNQSGSSYSTLIFLEYNVQEDSTKFYDKMNALSYYNNGTIIYSQKNDCSDQNATYSASYYDKKINIKYLAMLTLLVAPWRKQNGMTQIYLKEKELQCQDNYQRIMAGFWGRAANYLYRGRMVDIQGCLLP